MTRKFVENFNENQQSEEIEQSAQVVGKEQQIEQVDNENQQSEQIYPENQVEDPEQTIDIDQVEQPTQEVEEIHEKNEPSINNNNETKQRGYYTKMNLNDLMIKFAEVHNQYYNKKTHTKEEINKKRQLNYAMKKLIEKEIKSLSTEDALPQQKDEELINQMTNPVEQVDIEELATNELAVAKLFKIQARGVYEKNGESPVRLTQKQRAALASVLIQVSEKRLQGEQTKTSLSHQNSSEKTLNQITTNQEFGGI